MAIPRIFGNGINYIVDMIDGLGSSLFGDSWGKVNEAFIGFIDDFTNLPQKLWSSIMAWWDSSSEEKVEGATSAIGSLFDGIVNTFKDLANLDLSMDDVKQSFMNAFDSLKSKLGSMWDSIKNWWNDTDDKPSEEAPKPTASKPPTPTASQPKTTGNQTVTAPAEKVKTEKIEQADQTQPTEQQTAQATGQEDQSKLLGQILNTLETQAQNNGQLAIILRQIADNTEPARNV